LELLAFNAQKIKGHVTLTTPPFRKFYSGVMSGIWFQTSVLNFIQIGFETVRGHARTHKSALDIIHRTSDTSH